MHRQPREGNLRSRNATKLPYAMTYAPNTYTSYAAKPRSRSPVSATLARPNAKKKSTAHAPPEYTVNVQQISINKPLCRKPATAKSPDPRKMRVSRETPPAMYQNGMDLVSREVPALTNFMPHGTYSGIYGNALTGKAVSQMTLDEILQASAERRKNQYRQNAETEFISRDRTESFGGESESPSTNIIDSVPPDPSMEKVWGATMKLTEEVMEIRKAMEQMQSSIIGKDNDIANLHTSISDEKAKGAMLRQSREPSYGGSTSSQKDFGLDPVTMEMSRKSQYPRGYYGAKTRDAEYLQADQAMEEELEREKTIALMRRIQELESNNAVLSENYQAIMEDYKYSKELWEAEKEKLIREVNTRDKHIEKLKLQQQAAHSTPKTQLKKLHETNEALQKERNALAAKLDQVEQELSRFRSNVRAELEPAERQTENDVPESAQEYLEKIEMLNKEKEAAQAESEALRIQLKGLKEKAEKVSRTEPAEPVSREVARLKSEFKELEAQYLLLREENKKLKEQNDDLTETETDVKVERVKVQLKEITKKYEDSVQTAKNIESKLREKETQLDQIKDEFSKLEEDYTRISLENRELKSQVQSLSKDEEKLNKILPEFNKTTEDLLEEKAKLQQKEETIRNLEQEHEKLKQDLELANNMVQSMTNKIASVTEWQIKYQEAQMELNRYREEINRKGSKSPQKK